MKTCKINIGPNRDHVGYRLVEMGDCEHWTHLYVFSTCEVSDISDEALVSHLGIGRYADGVGRKYARRAHVTRGRFKTTVHHSGGLDI